MRWLAVPGMQSGVGGGLAVDSLCTFDGAIWIIKQSKNNLYYVAFVMVKPTELVLMARS